jgi:predicted transcriptional regulator
MTAGKDWQFLYTIHGKDTKNCCTIDYISHNVNSTITLLLIPSFHPDRFEINEHPAKAFPKMIKYLYRILAHIFFHHSNLFNSLDEKFKISERLTLYCKKFKIMESKDFIIKL